jgi:hypothetical protein
MRREEVAEVKAVTGAARIVLAAELTPRVD